MQWLGQDTVLTLWNAIIFYRGGSRRAIEIGLGAAD